MDQVVSRKGRQTNCWKLQKSLSTDNNFRFSGFQQNLQSTLVTLGEVDHAMDDIIEFLTRTEEELQELDDVYGDPKFIEAHLRKLGMMQKDLKNREQTVDKLNKAVSGHDDPEFKRVAQK